MKISGGVPLAFLLTSALVMVLIPSTTAEPRLWPSDPSPSQDCNHCCVADGAEDGGSGLVARMLAVTAACCIYSFFSKSLVSIPLGNKAKRKPGLHTLNMGEGKIWIMYASTPVTD